jgi:rubrerythrin
MKSGLKVTKRQMELYEVFQMAITSEKAAQAMYDSALSYCDDEMMREILTGLREDEKRHEKELVHLHSKLKKAIDGISQAAPAEIPVHAGPSAKRRAAAR